MKRRGILLFIALLYFIPQTSAAEEDTMRAVAVFDFLNLTDQGEFGEYATLFTSALTLDLEYQGYSLVDCKRMEDEAAALAEAFEKGADAVVSAAYRVEGGKIYVSLLAWDLLAGRVTLARVLSGPSGLDALNTIDSLSAEISSGIREGLPPLTPAERVIRKERVSITRTVLEHKQENTREIILRSQDEGADVFGGDVHLGIIKNRILPLEVQTGSSLILTLKKQNRWDQTQTFKITEKIEEYKFSRMYRKPAFDLSTYLNITSPSSITASLRWYPVPDFVFLSSYGDLSWGDEFFLIHGAAGVGAYPFLSSRSFFRICLSLLYSVNYYSPAEGSPLIYSYPNMSVRAEISLKRCSFFVEALTAPLTQLSPEETELNIPYENGKYSLGITWRLP